MKKNYNSPEEFEQVLIERERKRIEQITAFENAKTALLECVIETLHIPQIVEWLAKRIK